VSQELGIVVATLALAGCSLLVHFDTEQPCDGGACVDAGMDVVGSDTGPDTTVTNPDATGKDSGPVPRDTGSLPDTTLTNDAGHCTGKADGTQWGPEDVDRCCNQVAVTTDQNANCGACGIACTGVQHCGTSLLSAGQYLCLGCVGNTDCWSGFCVFDSIDDASVDAGSHCAVESDDAGDCISPCPAGTPPTGPPPCCPTGSRCAMPSGVTLNYCTYDDAG
jgi:hypothetical protein